MTGGTQKMEFIYLKMYIYFYMFKLQSLSKYSPFDAVCLLGHFFHCSKQFLNSSILMPFRASAIFCFASSTSAKCFPLRTFFIWGKNSRLQQDWVNKEGGAWGSCSFFGQKLLTLSVLQAGVLINDP